MFKVENLYDVQNVDVISHINTALRAHVTLQRDVDYMVVDGEVLIVASIYRTYNARPSFLGRFTPSY